MGKNKTVQPGISWGAFLISWGAFLISWGAFLISWGAFLISWGAFLISWVRSSSRGCVPHLVGAGGIYPDGPRQAGRGQSSQGGGGRAAEWRLPGSR